MLPQFLTNANEHVSCYILSKQMLFYESLYISLLAILLMKVMLQSIKMRISSNLTVLYYSFMYYEREMNYLHKQTMSSDKSLYGEMQNI